jgi:ubiquinone/menaquinone biosynthesis C-methylase UbiE
LSVPSELNVLPNPRDRRCWARGLDNRLRRRWAPPRTEVDLLEPTLGDTVADLGAGPGYFETELLARIGPQGRLDLVDIDEENLEIARRRFPGDPRVSVLVGSAASVPGIPSESVDRVLMSLVLCCLRDKSGALAEAWRILRPGGRAVVTYPRPGPLRRFRRHSLAMTASLWSSLVAQRPWIRRTDASGWWVVRHVLERPRTAPGT